MGETFDELVTQLENEGVKTRLAKHFVVDKTYRFTVSPIAVVL